MRAFSRRRNTSSEALRLNHDPNYSRLFPAALAFFHLAFAIADNRDFAAALIFFLPVLTGFAPAFVALNAAHRAFAAAAILALAAALMPRFLHFFLGASVAAAAGPPSS